MYFQNFPYTFYTLDDAATVQVVTNITTRIQISDEVKNNLSLFDKYDIKDGESPELVADKFYNNSQLHWIILHYNEIIDPRFEWPLDTNNLSKYVSGKYANVNAVHHYEDSNGYYVNSDVPGCVSITNYEYEDTVNESKRQIKILKPAYVNGLIQDFKRKLET
jgi:hypothetical protein